MRTIVAVIGGLLAASALVMASLCVFPAAIMFAVWAAIFLIGLVVERWRYKGLAATPPGPDWQRTDERFVDPETGKLVTVYFHPRTGERRYIAV